MNLNIVIALIMGILAATGVDTKNVDVDAIKKSVIESQINDASTQSINNSNENNNDADNDNAICCITVYEWQSSKYLQLFRVICRI